MLLGRRTASVCLSSQSRQVIKLSANLLPRCPAYTDVSPVRQLQTSPPHLNILHSLRQLPSSPAPALGLGLAGLIPFVSAPLYMYNSGHFLPDVATAHLLYGASILSFLGGVRWGLLVSSGSDDWAGYTWSVTPSLLAWTSLLLPNITAGYVLCTGGLVAAGVLDLQHPSYPPWFKGLRLVLTLVASLSLLSAAVFTQTLASKKQPSDYLN